MLPPTPYNYEHCEHPTAIGRQPCYACGKPLFLPHTHTAKTSRHENQPTPAYCRTYTLISTFDAPLQCSYNIRSRRQFCATNYCTKYILLLSKGTFSFFAYKCNRLLKQCATLPVSGLGHLYGNLFDNANAYLCSSIVSFIDVVFMVYNIHCLI